MRISVLRLTLLLPLFTILLLPGAAGAQENPPADKPATQQKTTERERVRANDPTVVTVHGTRPEVEQDQSREHPGLGGRIKSGAAAAWNGVVGLTGWLLNTKDDIPSERERTRRKESEQK
jgi:hypothetical protein